MNMKASQEFERYLARVGATPAARLAWVLRVLNGYRTHQGMDWLPGDWDNLTRELAFFAGIGNAVTGWGGVSFLNGEITERPSPKEAKAILASFQQMVDDAEHHRPLPVPTFEIKQEFRWSPNFRKYLLEGEHPERATWEDRARYALVHLVKEEADRIQRCPARLPHEGKKCFALFLKSKRQKYCSKSCMSREMTRAKRQRDASQEATKKNDAKARAKQKKRVAHIHKKGGPHGTKKHR